MTEQLNIPELRRLHAAATPGEWCYDDGVTDLEGTPDAERGKPAWITTRGNKLIAELSGTNGELACIPNLSEMDANGKCIVASHNALPELLDALDAAEQERDEAVALIDAAKSDVRPESFLENAQALLAKCVAPYSCEQMKVVADAMAQWYRKWELMSEVAMKAREDSDTLKAKLAALAVAWDAYLNSEDEDRVAEWIALCEAFSAAKAAP
jgi:hypothetical protein